MRVCKRRDSITLICTYCTLHTEVGRADLELGRYVCARVECHCIQSVDILGFAQALVEAVNEGKVRSIGVSNYGVHHLDELEAWQKQQSSPKEAGILSVNQVELHPWLARPDIVKWCQARNVVLEAYSPLVRATRNEDPALTPIAKKHNKTPTQVLLRWGLQQGFVILPKSVTLSRIEENANLYDFELDKEDLAALDTGEYSPCAWDPTKEPLEK